MRDYGAAKMNSDMLPLIYPAIFIFSMLLIGLVFTVIEFKKLNKKDNESKKRDDN